MLSVFLMGCHDTKKDQWLTVTKVHTGHDDAALEGLQSSLLKNMTKISKEATRVPPWLKCTNTMIPDFVAKDPKKQPVWEIMGEILLNINHYVKRIHIKPFFKPDLIVLYIFHLSLLSSICNMVYPMLSFIILNSYYNLKA